MWFPGYFSMMNAFYHKQYYETIDDKDITPPEQDDKEAPAAPEAEARTAKRTFQICRLFRRIYKQGA
jgi:hypothetical protein